MAQVAANDRVFRISLDAPVSSTDDDSAEAASRSGAVNAYPFAAGADEAWGAGASGRGVGVALIDTGISPSGHEDFKGSDGNSRVIAEVEVNGSTSNLTDGYGHGTHIAGIIGGDGGLLKGKYVGVAPEVNLINVKIADEEGNASVGDALTGLEWAFNNRVRYNIRLVNLSLQSSVAESYTASALDGAVEFLWLNNIFVVVAAGNLGQAADAVTYPPANDPFVMTAGAIDDNTTKAFGDDAIASWSSRGTTQDGFTKPELFAPGRNIVSVIDTNSILYKEHPERVVDDKYCLSGTSMSAAVVSGAAALVIETHKEWTPDQVKCTLIARSRSLSGSGSRVVHAGNAAKRSAPDCASNPNLVPSTLIPFGAIAKIGAVAHVLGAENPTVEAANLGLDLGAVGATSLESVDWGAIKWDAIKWGAIKWGVIKWDAIKWSAIKWSAIKWEAVKWNADVDFTAIKWGAIKWSSIK